MSSTPNLSTDSTTGSGASARPSTRSDDRSFPRPHVLPYIATVPARARRAASSWKGTILVSTTLALIVVTAVAVVVAVAR